MRTPHRTIELRLSDKQRRYVVEFVEYLPRRRVAHTQYTSALSPDLGLWLREWEVNGTVPYAAKVAEAGVFQ